MTSLVYCLLCTVYYDINYVHAPEHAQMLTVYCRLCHLCSLFTSVSCLLCFTYFITCHDIIFKPEPGHIVIQQNCAHCLGNAQS